MFEFESDRSGSVVELGEPVAALAELETGDQSAVRGEVPSHVGDDVSFGSGAEKDHDVAGERDKVEGAGEVDVEQVGEMPLEFGGLRSGGVEHSRIEVDADDLVAATSELDRDPTGAAALRRAPILQRSTH